MDKDSDGVLDEMDQCQDTLFGYPVRENGCPLLQGEIRNIQFSTNSATLNVYTQSTLLGLAELFKQYPEVKVEFHSHTQRIGSDQQQVDLSRRRLQTIATFFANNGVTISRIRFIAYGGQKADLQGRYSDRIEVTEQR